MQSYNMDSDSDEDDDDIHEPAIHDISSFDTHSLKENSSDLLDTSWKLNKNKSLLTKMLELEEPSITPKMVDFLLQDGVCEILLGFITQLGTIPRPTHDEIQSEAMKLSFRATMLLSADEPSDTLMALISKRAGQIAKCVFDIFRDDSAGSFYHAFRLLEFLLRHFPCEVFEGIQNDGLLSDRMASLVRYIGYASVADILIMLVCLTPVNRTSHTYSSCMKHRWTFFEGLGSWLLLLKLTEIIVNPSEYCRIDTIADEDNQSAAAAQVLQELVEKLSIEDTGEFLLQPLGYVAQGYRGSLLDMLIDTAGTNTQSQSRRKNATRLLCFLVRRSTDPELMCIVGPSNGLPATPSYVPNRLYPLKQQMISMLTKKCQMILDALYSFRGNASAEEAVKHSGYIVSKPFTALRTDLFELLVLLVEADICTAEQISVELWIDFVSWIVIYAHNNVYHNFFYRLLFAVLRSNEEAIFRRVFVQAKILTNLLDNFVQYDVIYTYDDALVADVDVKSPSHVSKVAARGIIMNCCNAIRLQAAAMPPSAFLRQYLKSIDRWNAFLPQLRLATEFQQNHAMGLKVSLRYTSHGSVEGDVKQDSDIDHGSRLAKSLGFIDEIAWPPESRAELKKSRKNKFKKKKSLQKKKLSKTLSEGQTDSSLDIDDDDGIDEEDGNDDDDDDEEGQEYTTNSEEEDEGDKDDMIVVPGNIDVKFADLTIQSDNKGSDNNV